jgi:hypothetical protein
MPLVGFEPAIPASERPQTHALDRAVAGIGGRNKYLRQSMRCDPLLTFPFLLSEERHAIARESKLYAVNTITLAVGTTTFLLKYNNLLHVSTLPCHLHACSIVRFKEYPNLLVHVFKTLPESICKRSKYLYICILIKTYMS